MKIILQIVTFFFICSCSPEELTLKDLKFNDVEKRHIKNNRITKSIFYYDTAQLYKIPGADTNRIIQLLKEGIGTGEIKYDSNGNIIYHRVREFMGTLQTFEFDSLQFLRKKIYDTDFRIDFSINYHFDPKNLTLYQCWDYWDVKDTSRFIFNSSGFVLKEAGRIYDDHGNRKFSKEYFYKNDTLIKTLTTFNKNSDNINKTEENIFYENGIVSKIETLFIYSPKEKYSGILKTVKEFDKRGLPIKLIETYSDNRTINKLFKHN